MTIGPATDFAARHPGLRTCFLSPKWRTRRCARTVSAKAALYARAGIHEYWLLDIAGRQLLVHRQPDVTGYADVVVYGEDELAATLALPDAPVRIAELLPAVA